jgi:transposase
MLYHTGCDAHKRNCIMHHMTDDGAHGLHKNITTDEQSIHNFLNQLDAPTTMTLEAGCNWWALYNLFESHPLVKEVNVVDPGRSRKIAEELSVLNGYGRASNDHIDSEMLADMRRRELISGIAIPTQEQMEVRTINRFRFDAVSYSVRAKNKITSLLAFYGSSVPIHDVINQSDTYLNVKERLPEYVIFNINLLIKRIQLADEQIDLCQSRLNTLLPESNPNMKIVMSHPGIGPVFGRIILTEILDIHYFKAPKYLISYAGLAPFEKESAGHKKGKIKLNRHCNYYLKYAFVSAANNASDYPTYRKKYRMDVKKHGNLIAKINLARRMVKNIYWMLTRQQVFK